MKKYQAVEVGLDGLKAYWFNFEADVISPKENGNYAYDIEGKTVAFIPFRMVIRLRAEEE